MPQTEAQRKWYQNNKKRHQHTGELWRKRNMIKCAIIAKNGKNKLRRQMIEAYGGKCACCGEDNHKFLTLDHIFDDGGRERRLRSNGRQNSNYAILCRLRKLGWPHTRHQIMCFNCNCGKNANNGICPHKEKP